MSQWLGFTNQKLYQARLLLDQRGRANAPAALNQALEQSALYQLYDAYVSYLNELADIAGHRQPVDSLESLLAATPLVIGEMTEIRVLRQDSFSWLTAFLSAVAAQAQPVTVAPVQIQEPAGNLIASVRDTSDDARDWWQALSDLIDSQRQNRRES